MLLQLVKVCCERYLQSSGSVGSDGELNFWVAAAVLRFSETMSRTILDMQRYGCSPELLASMLSVYEYEYRVARVALGKPLDAEGT